MQLNSNTIIQLSDEQSASNLNATRLNFIGKNIESIEAGVFVRYKSLEYLSLGWNKIKVLPQGIFHSLRELKEIRLYNNKISSLHPELFKENKKLEVIDVGCNELSELNKKELFQNLPELKILYIYGNKIKTFDFECLKGFTKLEELWFHDNELSEIKGLDDFKKLFPNLKKCHIHNNNFSCSYMQRVVETLERMNITIGALNKSKGILYESVYGLKCIPDDVYYYSLRKGRELESKVADTEEKLKKLSDENIQLRADLNKSNSQNNGLKAALAVTQQQNKKLSEDNKSTKDEMWKAINELKRQQAGSDAELQTLKEAKAEMRLELQRSQVRSDAKMKTLKEEMIKSNRKINGLEAAIDVHHQQNWKLSKYVKEAKEEMLQLIGELQLQQARKDAELTKSNRKINGLEAALDAHHLQNWKLSKYIKEAKEEWCQELQRQQARTDANIMTLKDQLTKSNRKIDELEAAQDVNKQQNLQLSAELKEEMWPEIQHQQAATDAELKMVRKRTDEAVSEFTRQIEWADTSCNSRCIMFKEKVRSFYVLSGEFFQMNRDFKQFEAQVRKYEGQITEWEANMETSLRAMQQVMEDHKVSYPKERPLIWEILEQLQEHGNKNQKGLDGLKADFEKHNKKYAKQKTKVADQLSHCEANLDALQTEMAERGDEMAFLYRTDRPKIFTSLIELKRTSDFLLADNRAVKELRALAGDNEIE